MTNFSFKCVENTGSVKIKLIKVGLPYLANFRYGKNPPIYQDYTLGEEILLEPGDQLYFNAAPNSKRLSKNIQNRYQFVTLGDGDLILGGDLMRIASEYVRPVNDYEFNSLFEGCKNIVSFKDDFELPSTVAKFCYANLFKDCSRLTGRKDAAGETIPLILRATDLAPWCYSGMFNSCTSLIYVPDLPATGLAKYCYDGMFYNCSSLSTAPVLSAATLAPFCYCSMFNMCSNLKQAPVLTAGTLVEGCYKNMFMDCTSLSSIEANISLWNENYTGNWVKGVSVLGLFISTNQYLDWLKGYSKIPLKWTSPVFLAPLTFTAKSAGAAIALSTVGSPDAITLQYNRNQTGWHEYTLGDILEMGNNDSIAFSGANDHFSKYDNYYNFIMTGTIEADGNIQSLMNFSDSVKSNCYKYMFSGCTSLTKAPSLLATTLYGSCYESMFQGCTSLSTAPLLPATTLANSCYNGMFWGCSNLSNAPLLPATALANYCYQEMFIGCTSLSTAPLLPTTGLARECYMRMFQSCTSLSTAPLLPATGLEQGCYHGMFQGCTSLTTPPSSLPATDLAQECYYSMFQGCTSLSTAPLLPATGLAQGCYRSMFRLCTNLTDAPYLPATIIARDCYMTMFWGDSKLSAINVLFTEWGNHTSDWCWGTPNVGVFTKPSALSTIQYEGQWGMRSYIPPGWTVINKD